MSDREVKSSSERQESQKLPGDRGPGCLILSLVWVAACLVFVFFTKIYVGAIIASLPLTMAVSAMLSNRHLRRKNYEDLSEESQIYQFLNANPSTHDLKVYVSKADYKNPPTIAMSLKSAYISQFAIDNLNAEEISLLIESNVFEYKRPLVLTGSMVLALVLILVISITIRSINGFWLYFWMSATLICFALVASAEFTLIRKAFITYFSQENRANTLVRALDRLNDAAPPKSRLKNKWYVWSDRSFETGWLQKAAKAEYKTTH